LPVQLFHDFCHFSDISFVARGSSSEAGDFNAVTMRTVVRVSACRPKWRRSERSASIDRSFRSSCVAFEWVTRPIVVTRGSQCW